jgi:hypothetical protein
MEGYIVHGGIGMARGSLARIEDGRGLALEIWDGELWITQHGDRRDYFVKPGQRFTINREGRVLAYALRPSHVTLTAAVPAYYARRITLMVPGEARARVLYDRAQEAAGWLGGIGHRLARFWANAYARYSQPTTAALVLCMSLALAACGPSAGVSAAEAKPIEAAAMLHPPVAEGAADGAVFEYH